LTHFISGDAAAMAQVDINPNRLGYPEFLKQCASAREFSDHVAGLYTSGELGGHGHGRISDAEATVYDWKIKNGHAKSVCFQGKIFEAETTVRGSCDKNGVPKQHSLVFAQDTNVLKVLEPTSNADRVVVHLDMLLLSAQVPNAQGIPIGYRVKDGVAKTLFTYTNSGYNGPVTTCRTQLERNSASHIHSLEWNVFSRPTKHATLTEKSKEENSTTPSSPSRKSRCHQVRPLVRCKSQRQTGHSSMLTAKLAAC